MSVMPGTSESEQLEDFFKYLYGDQEGFAYVARKDPKEGAWKQDFFSWPSDSAQIADFCINSRAQWEVYMGPALYDSPDAKKTSVKGSQVFWCEFDGKTPGRMDLLPEPTMRILSSSEGHEHWYWRIDETVDADHLETVNRAITYMLGADSSGWDASQVLRPPSTFNHKREREVQVIETHDVRLPVNLFNGLPQPPPPVEVESPESIPDIQSVVFKYQFPKSVEELFRQGVPLGQRSTGLMRLGYYLAEMNMSNEEMLAVLLNADERWGKFSGRSDQVKRLLEIVTIARQKHPYKRTEEDEQPEVLLQPYGFLELLNSNVEIEWVWEGFLQKNGYLLMTGPSGIGKTQVTLDAAAHMALGKPFLERDFKRSKVGLLSLEMGLADIKQFMLTLKAAYTEEEQAILEEQFVTFPIGEPLNMSDDKVLAVIEQFIGDLNLDGLMIDSLGDATEEKLTDEEFRKFFDRMSKMRNRHNCFTWFIHHNRKASGDNKKPNKLSDVYGSQYITSKATTVVCLWQGLYANSIQMIPLKVRLSKSPDPFHIHRDENLHFTYMAPGVGTSAVSGSNGNGHSDDEDSQGQSPEGANSKPATDDTAAPGIILDDKFDI